MPPFAAAYLRLMVDGTLEQRARQASERLTRCDLCARYCRVDRTLGVRGAVCRTGATARVHGYGPHHGEEDPLRGTRGSGTIFFSGCSLRCEFCQNWDISHKAVGRELSPEALAEAMLELQLQGCHNINLVTPSHVVAQILEALAIAAPRGLRLPLVYNTGGYDSLEALTLLDGVIDIYMPDLKFGDSRPARDYAHVPDYWPVSRAAVREMQRQVGDLALDDEGVARRGLLVRHLILPGGLAGSEAVLRFLAEEISPRTYLNLMDQYRPCYRAAEHPPLDRRPSARELEAVWSLATGLGLERLAQRRRRWLGV